MRIKAVILPSVEEQRASGDDEIIDPKGVKYRYGRVSVFRNFSYSVPKDLVGIADNIRVEDGRLVGDIEIRPEFQGLVDSSSDFRFGGVTKHARLIREAGDIARRHVERSELLSIGMVSKGEKRPGW